MRRWRIRWRGFDDGPPPGVYPVFDVFDAIAEQRVLRYSLALGDEKAILLMSQFAPGVSVFSDAASNIREQVRTAVLRLNVRRLAGLLQRGQLPSADPHGRVDSSINEDDVHLLAAMLREEKECVFQMEDDRNLLCCAAAKSDETRIGVRDLRVVAPTSPGLCRGCHMPEKDLLCSHLMWPEVVGLAADAGILERSFIGAMCGRDSPEVSKRWDCRTNGNRCWERVVEEEDVRRYPPVGALSLAHAVDHLDLAWRAWHGRGHRLFEHRSAILIAGLTQPCSTRAELGQRLNEVDSILKAIVAPKDASKSEADQPGPLLRLQSHISDAMNAAGRSPADAGNLSEAIGRLRRIIDARMALEHPGTSKVAPVDAFRQLGLSWPVEDWSAAWDEIRRSAVDALLVVAELIEPFSA